MMIDQTPDAIGRVSQSFDGDEQTPLTIETGSMDVRMTHDAMVREGPSLESDPVQMFQYGSEIYEQGRDSVIEKGQRTKVLSRTTVTLEDGTDVERLLTDRGWISAKMATSTEVNAKIEWKRLVGSIKEKSKPSLATEGWIKDHIGVWDRRKRRANQYFKTSGFWTCMMSPARYLVQLLLLVGPLTICVQLYCQYKRKDYTLDSRGIGAVLPRLAAQRSIHI